MCGCISAAQGAPVAQADVGQQEKKARKSPLPVVRLENPSCSLRAIAAGMGRDREMSRIWRMRKIQCKRELQKLKE